MQETWSRIDHLPTHSFIGQLQTTYSPQCLRWATRQFFGKIRHGLGSSGISERNWFASAGGESAFLAFDPNNPDNVMGGSYLGTIELLDTRSTASTKIMIEPNLYLGLAAREMKYLYNWNAPIIRSVHDENTYYHGAQYLLKTTDEGLSWQVVSPDLTKNDDSKQGKGGPLTNEAVGAENYGTLSYVQNPHTKLE